MLTRELAPEASQTDWAHRPEPFTYRQRPTDRELTREDADGSAFLARAGFDPFGTRPIGACPVGFAPEGSPHADPTERHALNAWKARRLVIDNSAPMPLESAPEPWEPGDAGVNRLDARDALRTIFRTASATERATLAAMAEEATGEPVQSDGAILAAMEYRHAARSDARSQRRILPRGWNRRVAARTGQTPVQVSRTVAAIGARYRLLVIAATSLGSGYDAPRD